MFHVINKRELLVEVWCTLISLNFYLFQKNLQVLGAPNGFCCLKRFLLEALLVIRQVMPQVSHAAIHSKKGSYGHGRHEVIDGARDKTQVFRPNVRTCGLSEQMYCSTCDNVGNFRRPGNCDQLAPPPVTPLATENQDSYEEEVSLLCALPMLHWCTNKASLQIRFLLASALARSALRQKG